MSGPYGSVTGALRHLRQKNANRLALRQALEEESRVYKDRAFKQALPYIGLAGLAATSGVLGSLAASASLGNYVGNRAYDFYNSLTGPKTVVPNQESVVIEPVAINNPPVSTVLGTNAKRRPLRRIGGRVKRRIRRNYRRIYY